MRKTPLLAKIISLLLLILTTLFLLIGGVWLIALGGSWYYAIAGVALGLTTYLYARNCRSALWLYVAIMVATFAWSFWESGYDFWGLAPRLGIWFLFGLWLILPFTTRSLGKAKSAKTIIAVVMVAMLGILFYGYFNDPISINGTIDRAQPQTTVATPGVADGDWPAYGRTQAGVRYSPLTQINTDNVKDLKVAWIYHTEDFPTSNDSGETTSEVTPIKIGDKMFICTTHQFLDAIDPATGTRLWRFDPKLISKPTYQHLTCRGVSYYDANNTAYNPASSEKGLTTVSAQCPRKVFLPVNDGRLFAINADNGEACTDFADNGVIDLLKDMPNAYPGGYQPTSPPVVTGNTIVIGGSVTDNFSSKEPSGVIRGYDVNSGKLRWIFDTGAKDPNLMPGENGTFVHNSPNAWAPLAYDAQKDIVYVPTGVGTPDIWGGDRSEYKERYANSVLALDASTGKLIWHFQQVHHDLWDMDVPSQPTLAEIKDKDGNIQPAIYVLTKTGNVFILNRYSGEAIIPFKEEPVPQSVKRGPQTKGEHYAKTQPFSDLNLGPHEKLTDKDMWGGTMFDQLACRIMFKRLNYDGIFTPPSENGTLVYPGDLGVFEWGGMSVNQDRQIALMNPLALPFVSKLSPENPDRPILLEGAQTENGVQPMYGVPYSVNIHAFLSPIGLPCKQPPWMTIAGVDLNDHKVVWRHRIGTIRDSLPKLMQLPPLKIGVPGLGGVASTAGGVMFIAATQDDYIRAFDVSNGKQLWQARLPGGGQAVPMIYEVNGKQYLAIMAGGHSSFGTKTNDTLVAYALPDAEK